MKASKHMSSTERLLETLKGVAWLKHSDKKEGYVYSSGQYEYRLYLEFNKQCATREVISISDGVETEYIINTEHTSLIGIIKDRFLNAAIEELEMSLRDN